MPRRRMFRNTRMRFALIEQVGYASPITARPVPEYCKHIRYAFYDARERVANPGCGSPRLRALIPARFAVSRLMIGRREAGCQLQRTA